MTEHHRTVQRQQAFRLHACARPSPGSRAAARHATEAQGRRPVRRPPASSNRRASRGSRASRRVKLCSIPADSGSAVGRPKPPASWAGVSPRGSSRSASGFPPVSATIRSSTDSSSRAARTDSSSARASRRPSGSTRSCGKRASPCADVTRREHERDPLRQQTARHERERSARRAVEPLRVVDDAQERLLLGGFGEEPENREPDEKRARRLSGAEPECDAERVTLRIGQTLDELEDRRTELLQRRVVELHLPLDARQSERRANPRPSRPRTRAARSCRRRGHRARRGRRRDRRAPYPAPARAPRARVAFRAADPSAP